MLLVLNCRIKHFDSYHLWCTIPINIGLGRFQMYRLYEVLYSCYKDLLWVNRIKNDLN